MRESDIHRLILRDLSRDDVRLFRNNVAQAWQGRVVRHEPGLLVLADPRPIQAGLCVGSSDLIGWRSVVITPEMVGQRLAVFAGVEVKTDRGRATEEQKNFIEVVQRFGGLAGVARSVDDARIILKGE